ncbi:hypothetical protein QVD17_19338 [Tagetes erecta]|uniref:Uncharacterized protein n=1 Tax=Tagetes erecta TaxID=13708 RepID=A0AAD8KJE4_TARER|nr:hypothetical protein QVD17_19338 [Tagetes erecta]
MFLLIWHVTLTFGNSYATLYAHTPKKSRSHLQNTHTSTSLKLHFLCISILFCFRLNPKQFIVTAVSFQSTYQIFKRS